MNEKITNNLKDSLISIGLKKGDYVLIHCSLKTFINFDITGECNILKIIQDMLLQIVGEEGLICVPSFNFNFKESKIFDVNKTPATGMGVFSEFIRQNPESKRSSHPTHSISILGKNSDYISNLEGKTTFGEGSVFDYLLKQNCKILYMGDSFVGTFFHLAEERVKVSYRFWKKFRGYVVKNSIKRKIEIQYYARNFELEPEPILNRKKLFKFLDEKKIFKKYNNNFRMIICSSKDFVEHCMLKLEEDDKYFISK